MANKLNGRFKLKKATNVVPFYKAVGVSQAEIDQYAAFDDPAQGLEVVQKIEGDDYTLEYWLGGQKVVAQSYKLGVYREGQHENIKFKIKTVLEGDKIIDINSRPGSQIKDTKYVRSIDGNKMTVIMTSEGVDIVSTREYERM